MYSSEMLYAKTNRELRDICAEKGITGVSKTVKDQLVQLILDTQVNQQSSNDQVSDAQFALVKYGCTQVSLPVGGMTIAEVVATYGPDIFNMPANVTAGGCEINFSHPPFLFFYIGVYNMNDVTILGCGSLGGFIAKELCEKNISLKLVDYDIVEDKNISLSLFNYEDIGQKKIIAFKNKFKNSNIECYDSSFEGCRNLLPKDKLILNCTDRTLVDDELVNLKCCISQEFLILDARKKTNKNNFKFGYYSSNIKMEDIVKYSKYISGFILSEYIYKFITENCYITICLDDLDNVKYEDIYDLATSGVITKNYIHNYYEIFDYVDGLSDVILDMVNSKRKLPQKFIFENGFKSQSVIISERDQRQFSQVAGKLDVYFKKYLKMCGDTFIISNKIDGVYILIPAIGGA